MSNQNTSLAYDPDFDEPKEAPGSPPLKSALEMMPPKMLFGAGIITAMLVLGTIGFFVLLSVLLKGGGLRLN